MISETEIAIPSEFEHSVAPVERSAAMPVPVRARRKLLRWLATLVLSAAFFGLLGFNAWWYWRDTRPVASLRTIEAWIAREQYARAEDALRAHLRRAAHDAEARMMLARVLAARGDMAACARELHQVPSWWPNKPDALFREAQAYLTIDRAREAEQALLAVIEADPLHPPGSELAHDASQELLKLYAMEDRWEDAFGVLWTAYDRSAPADRPVLLSMRIRCELQRVAPTESIKLLRRYVAADPQDWEARRSLANVEMALGDGADAVREMRACIEGRPNDARTWRDYLTILQSLGDAEAFNAALERVPKSAEDEPEIWALRGQSRERNGDAAGAAENYREALQRNPNLVAARYRLAMIEERLGHRQEAAVHRKRWQELRDARAKLAQAYSDYYAAFDRPAKDLRDAVKKLASICETIGWLRVAEGWNRYAATL
jgi:tetratricopeptide (TPR) repeat protein